MDNIEPAALAIFCRQGALAFLFLSGGACENSPVLVGHAPTEILII